MEGMNRLQAASFFGIPEIAAKKRKNEKTDTRTKKVFAALLKKRMETKAANIFTEEIGVQITDTAVTSPKDISFDEKLSGLIDDVYAAGDELKKNSFTAAFTAYRQSLAHFMRFVVDNSYEVQVRDRRRSKKQRRNTFVTVQTINTKLDELAAEILYNQGSQLRILAKVEEINGILIDFLL